MYLALKKTLKALVPARAFAKWEPAMRRVLGLWYIGNKVACPVCEGHFRKFIYAGEGHEALCPRCGCLPRARFLHQVLFAEIEDWKMPLSVIHFSPSRALKHKLRHVKGLVYETADYDPGKEDHTWDLTQLPESAGGYDLAICFHVLEHIPDDRQAMRELYRILKPGGLALVQTPFKAGEIDEDPDALSWTNEARLARFGQEDHVRIYSQEGLAERLTAAGFEVEVRTAEDAIGEEGCAKAQISLQSVILFAWKNTPVII